MALELDSRFFAFFVGGITAGGFLDKDDDDNKDVAEPVGRPEVPEECWSSSLNAYSSP